MVITCPSCAARYRLNPDKVQGRGAKITCPKCSHVFVVFTDPDAEAEAKPPAAPKVRTPPRPAAPPTPETNKRSATQTGAFRAVGISRNDDSLKRDSKSNVRVVAPGPRSTRRVRALSTPASGMPQGPGSGSKSVATADMEIGSAAELDFRSVGIKTWKVKVAIGLIYDFSDISTLQKYLADKKVTPDDLISHNNSEWTRIGDIEDLDAHFVETWRVARAAIDSGEAPAPKKKKKKAEADDGASAAPVGTSTDSFRIDTSRGRSTGNYPAPAPPRRRAPEPEEEPDGKKKGLMILAAVLVLGGLAWMFSQPEDSPLAAEPTPPVRVEDLGPSDAELKQIQENIQNELEAQRERLKREVGADPTEVAEEDAPRELVPVPPSERSDPTPTQQPQMPKYTPPTPQKAPVAQQAPPKKSSGEVNVGGNKGNPGAVYLSAGNTKLSGGDFAGAVKMFKLAVGKDPKCGECYAGLAKAEKALGNAQAATAAEQKAQDLKSPQSMASP